MTWLPTARRGEKVATQQAKATKSIVQKNKTYNKFLMFQIKKKLDVQRKDIRKRANPNYKWIGFKWNDTHWNHTF